MNTKPIKVSVIIPAYNTKKYLKKCIDSLLSQTLKELEIIVVDDASTEDIGSLILAEYSNYPNVIYLRNDVMKKPGGARNRGIKIASGEYISFCDSDDWVDLNLYETAVNYMDNHSADIGMYSMIREYDNISRSEVFKCKYDQLYILNSDIAIKILSGQYNMGIKIAPACINKIYRKSFLNEISALFEENTYFQGLIFTMYTFLKAKRIICIPDILYHHYKRSNSVVQSFNEDHIKDYLTCFNTISQYLEDANCKEQYLYDYYRLCEGYLNLIVGEIFAFVPNEDDRKKYLINLIETAKCIVDYDRYFDYISAEELRRHIQPEIKDTMIYLK